MLLFRRYRVIRELGRGGMGVVKLVPDLVVKDTEAIADLRKEVLRGMALTHPGVVRTHNFERDESGAGIVMEFIESHTLTELKTQQPGGCFDPEQILPWIEQLCAVLDYAHREAHIVHRDLKPRNVMRNRAGKIKVADFGIAAVISDSMSKHSMEGKVSGTLSYMSPQRAQGMMPGVPDDIHAFGATIYELLTGKPPFFRGNPLMIQTQVITVVPPRMSERREELEVTGRTPIPPPWEVTIAACLAKDPAERPQRAGEVLARLRRSSVEHPVRVPFSTARTEPLSSGAPTTVSASESSAHREGFREPRKPAPEPGAPPINPASPPSPSPDEPSRAENGLQWFAGSMVLTLVALNYCYSRLGADNHTLVTMQVLPLVIGFFLGWRRQSKPAHLFAICFVLGYVTSLLSVQLTRLSKGTPLEWNGNWWLYPVWLLQMPDATSSYAGVNYFGIFAWTVPIIAGCSLGSALRNRRDRK